LIAAAVARENADLSRAAVPATNGAAALVPLILEIAALEPITGTFSPGALRPRCPVDALRLELASGRPESSHAITGIVQGWLVKTEPPIIPWFPAATTISTSRAAA